MDIKTLVTLLEPAEGQSLLEMEDKRTGARYFELHILGDKLINLGTTDVPLDPESQAEYRANREPVLNAPAFEAMKEDALKGRTFSNIVAEIVEDSSDLKPIKIIGGQHRFEAIRNALDRGVNEYHGVKLYHSLDTTQRLDVQLISNTSIAISPDLFDRMQETVRGPKLRSWCQDVGLLALGQDFADQKRRGGPISVHDTKIFILNFFAGAGLPSASFPSSDVVPEIPKRGTQDPEWEAFLVTHPKWEADPKLAEAAREFVRLNEAQRSFFAGQKRTADFANKAMNRAILSAWALIAGVLSDNDVRLQRHFELADTKRHDPLNAAELAKGRHKTDPDNYRGLGYRTDPKERGRFAELFYHQAETGKGINNKTIDVAIKTYHAKQAMLDVYSAKNS